MTPRIGAFGWAVLVVGALLGWLLRAAKVVCP